MVQLYHSTWKFCAGKGVVGGHRDVRCLVLGSIVKRVFL